MRSQPVSRPKMTRFPAVLEDRILYWMRNSHDSEWGGAIHFQGQVDESRMARAIRLCLDAEPILGCRFVPGFWRQYWERMENIPENAFFEVLEHSTREEDVIRFLASTPAMDVLRGPQFHAWLLRSQNDVLCLKCHHVAGDAGAGYELLYLLSSLYRKLGRDPDYKPEPNTAPRGLSQVSAHFTLADKAGIVLRGLKDMFQFMFPIRYWFFPKHRHAREDRMLLVRKIIPERFGAMKASGKSLGATFNDVMLAVFLRAFYTVINSSHKALVRVVSTVSLRRYIKTGQAGAFSNLSGFFYLNLGRGIEKTFGQTLARVRDTMKSYKKDFIGMGNFFLTMPVFKLLPFPLALWIHDVVGDLQKNQTKTEGKVAPLFTNAGELDRGRLDFGAPGIETVCMVPTVPYPPVMTLCLMSYGETTYATLAFCTAAIPARDASRLLDQMEAEMDAMAQGA